MATGLDNLKIYKMAEKLEIDVHHLTDSFSKDEKYRGVDQLRRSSASVANNIAEAYNKQSLKEKIYILNDIAKSEAEEKKKFNSFTEIIQKTTYNLSTYKLVN